MRLYTKVAATFAASDAFAVANAEELDQTEVLAQHIIPAYTEA